jgi:predicted PurR-regulated permease PerM
MLDTGPATREQPRAVVPRTLLVIVGLAAAMVTVLGLRALSDIVGPAFLALVLTVAVEPARPWMVRKGVPEWLASLLAILMVYVVLLGLALSLLVAGARFATLLPSYQDDLNSLLKDVGSDLQSLGITQQQIDQAAGSFNLDSLVSLVSGLAGGLLGLLSNLFFVVTLVLFMVFDASGFGRRLRALAPDRTPLVDALGSFAHGTRRYLVVSTVFGLIVAVIDTLALIWIGVPVAVLWGLLAFITNYIPNIGFVIGVLPPAVIGLLEGGPGMMLAVVGTYSVINVVIQSIIQPRVVGEAVGLSPTITMLSLVFWAATLGAIGALMAVPLSLLAKALLVDADPGSRWLDPLLSGRDPTPEVERP